MHWLEEIPKEYRCIIVRHLLKCNRPPGDETWISSVNYQPTIEKDNSFKNYKIFITICEHHRYSLMFEEDPNGETTSVTRRLDDTEFLEDPMIKEGTCVETSLEWLLDFFVQTALFRFIHVTLIPTSIGAITPSIRAHKIWIHGQLANGNNQLIGWWLSRFTPTFYAIHISSREDLALIKDNENLKTAQLLCIKGYTDIDRETFLNFEGMFLRIDDQRDSPLSYDGNMVVTIIKKWLLNGREQDMIINNNSISYEFWEPIKKYLKDLVGFESDERKLYFSHNFGRFTLIVLCDAGHCSARFDKNP